MRFLLRNYIFFTLSILCLFSCGSRKDFVYLQDIEKLQSYDKATVYEPKLQPDDMLSILITAESPEAAIPFNLQSISGNEAENNRVKSYLIDNAGFINFPVLGKLKLGGLTRTEATNLLASTLSEYIKDPGVNIRILNFKFSVLGEVIKPNVFTIEHERITLLEALGMAGDIGVYGKRGNILVIREIEGKKTHNRIDITKAGFLDSPFYYLAQNDVIYVEPNKTKINSSVIGPNIAVIISGASLIGTLLIILLR